MAKDIKLRYSIQSSYWSTPTQTNDCDYITHVQVCVHHVACMCNVSKQLTNPVLFFLGVGNNDVLRSPRNSLEELGPGRSCCNVPVVFRQLGVDLRTWAASSRALITNRDMF